MSVCVSVSVSVPPLRSTRLAVQLQVRLVSDDAPANKGEGVEQGEEWKDVLFLSHIGNRIGPITCPLAAAIDSHTKSSATTKNSS